jgi:alanyl-tRNA synthetase
LFEDPYHGASAEREKSVCLSAEHRAIAKKAASLQGEIKELRRQLDSANSKLSEIKSKALLDDVKTVGKIKLLTARIDARPDEARTLTDTFKSKFSDGVVIFAAVNDGKLNFVAAAGQDAVRMGAHAGNILKEISAICGGKGGGRPDSAMSGGRDLEKIDEALKRAEEIISAI